MMKRRLPSSLKKPSSFHYPNIAGTSGHFMVVQLVYMMPTKDDNPCLLDE